MSELEVSTTREGKVIFKFMNIINLVKEINDKINDEITIKRSEVKNLQFVPPELSTLKMTASSEYKNSFYVFHSISFEGTFGDNPDVFLIYSEDDSEIKFDRNEQALMGDKLSVNKLNKIKIINNKYQYKLKEQMSYYSNKDSEYDIRPFTILVIGDKGIGLATIVLVNKAFSKRVSSNCVSGTIPFTGKNPFIPFGRKIPWPKKQDLMKPLKIESLQKTFWLEEKYINNIVELKTCIIEDFLDPKEQHAYKSKYGDNM